MAGLIKKSVKKVFNVSKWAATDQLKENTHVVKKLFTGFFTKPRTENSPYDETFESAMNRLGLTEEDVIARQKQFFKMAMSFLIAAVILLVYTLFLFIHGSILAGFWCALLTVLVSVYFYRYHFWYIQTKHRTLGLSFKQWLAFTLNGKGKK
jgi:intracellular multiplication protein IcmV